MSLMSLTDVLAQVPKCAVNCLITAVTDSSCSLTNTTCICSTPSIDKYGTTCILSACSLPDTLFTKNLTATACNAPIRDKSAQYDITNITLSTITWTLVIIRILFKRFWGSQKALGWDDWVIMSTVALGVPCTVINIRGMTANGLGKDIWTLGMEKVTQFVLSFYIMEVLYLAEISLIKLSLSLFYLNIFPSASIRRLLWGNVIFNIIFGLVFVIGGIFQCTPISFYWTQYTDKLSGGRCFDINGFAWIHAALGVALDFWMIAIPLSQVRKLELHWKKKIGAIIMFLTGTFVTIVSILRLHTLLTFAKTTNPTWDNWSLALWSTVEVNVGIICTCLPTIRLILLRMFPRVFSTGRSNASRTSRFRSEIENLPATSSSNNGIMITKSIELSSVEASSQHSAASAGEKSTSGAVAESSTGPWSANHSF